MAKKFISNASVSITALLVWSVSPAAAWAQSDSADQEATDVAGVSDEEDAIIVTARRTEERLQDVPVSVTALGAAELENARVESLTDVQQLSPSLNITPLNNVGTAATVSIRGQVQTTAGVGVDPSTGVYINEIYVARPAGLDAAIFDVSSVQVLKGPQGTLFGRNSVGGAVLIETRRPGRDFGGYLDVSVQDPWGYSLEGAINIPVTEGVGLRLAGLRQYVEGYSRVVGADYRLDDTDRWSARATLDAQLTDNFRTTFFGDVFYSDVNGVATYPIVPNPDRIVPPQPDRVAYLEEYAQSLSRDFRLASQSQRTYGRARTGGVGNISELELSDSFTLKNIIGYRWQRSDDTSDLDGLAANILFVQVLSESEQFSEELQLQASLFDDSLDLIVGGYFFTENGIDRSNSYILRAPTSVARGQNRFFAENEAISGFAHASWALPFAVPAHVFGGIRLTEDTREIYYESRSVLANGDLQCTVTGATPAPECRVRDIETFPATTWDVGFDIRPIDGVMLYGTVARGYRTGGFNGRATGLTQQVPFFPEYVLSYEAGVKTEWNVGIARGTFNVAAFHADYTDIQRTLVVPGPSGLQSAVINAADATVEGVEVEASAAFGRDVRLRGFYSFIDPQYETFAQGTTDLSDNEFPFVPRHQAGAALDWIVARRPAGDEIGFNTSWSYRSGFDLEIINSPPVRVQSYHLVNAALRWDNINGSGISAEIFAQNLFDKEYNRGGFGVYTSLGVANVVRGAPRVIGASVRIAFGGEE